MPCLLIKPGCMSIFTCKHVISASSCTYAATYPSTHPRPLRSSTSGTSATLRPLGTPCSTPRRSWRRSLPLWRLVWRPLRPHARGSDRLDKVVRTEARGTVEASDNGGGGRYISVMSEQPTVGDAAFFHWRTFPESSKHM